MYPIQEIIDLIAGLTDQIKAFASTKTTLTQQVADLTASQLAATLESADLHTQVTDLTGQVATLKGEEVSESLADGLVAAKTAEYEKTIADLTAQVTATATAASTATAEQATAEGKLNAVVETAKGLLPDPTIATPPVVDPSAPVTATPAPEQASPTATITV